jgi:hypothetical protein
VALDEDWDGRAEIANIASVRIPDPGSKSCARGLQRPVGSDQIDGRKVLQFNTANAEQMPAQRQPLALCRSTSASAMTVVIGGRADQD